MPSPGPVRDGRDSRDGRDAGGPSVVGDSGDIAGVVGGEDALVERLSALFGRRVGPNTGRVTVGIGDDAAVFGAVDAGSYAAQVATVDTAIEGVHFRWDFAHAGTLGRRAFEAALSDLAAMGARPTYGLWSLTLGNVPPARALQFAEGIAEGAAAAGLALVGGNVTSGKEFGSHLTLVGEPGAHGIVRRSGARVGEGVFVSGPAGDAGLGLAALLAGHHTPATRGFIDAFLRPRAALALGDALGTWASAAMDVSDGLAADAPRLARASRVGLEIDLERVPRGTGFERVADALSLNPLAQLAMGGESYVLLATGPDGEAPRGFARIGRVVEGDGARFRYRGTPVDGLAGFDHVRR